MENQNSHEPNSAPPSFVAAAIANSRTRYLSFVRRRVSGGEIAEDILQEATIRALERADTLRERAAFDGWFFRILRNAIIDFRRRNGAVVRGKEAFSAEALGRTEAQERAVHPCACVVPLLSELKEEYREVLQRVEIEEQKVRDFAEQEGISPSNAGVRVHRARAALKKQVESTCGACAAAGCHDCCCR
jgi:RNA polymerase sigma factor (sigma-70 family)